MSKDLEAPETDAAPEGDGSDGLSGAPPLFGSWNRLYGAVVLNTLLIYLLLFLFSRYTR